MNYRLMVRYYHGRLKANTFEAGVYGIGDATHMLRYFNGDGRDAWLEPTEEKTYKVWCRNYKYQDFALVYDILMPPTDIGQVTKEIALMRMTQRVGEAGCDYWLEEVCDGDGR